MATFKIKNSFGTLSVKIFTEEDIVVLPEIIIPEVDFLFITVKSKDVVPILDLKNIHPFETVRISGDCIVKWDYLHLIKDLRLIGKISFDMKISKDLFPNLDYLFLSDNLVQNIDLSIDVESLSIMDVWNVDIAKLNKNLCSLSLDCNGYVNDDHLRDFPRLRSLSFRNINLTEHSLTNCDNLRYSKTLVIGNEFSMNSTVFNIPSLSVLENMNFDYSMIHYIDVRTSLDLDFEPFWNVKTLTVDSNLDLCVLNADRITSITFSKCDSCGLNINDFPNIKIVWFDKKITDDFLISLGIYTTWLSFKIRTKNELSLGYKLPDGIACYHGMDNELLQTDDKPIYYTKTKSAR